MTQTYIGAPIRRREDRRFLTGRGQFVDDVKLPNALHAAIVRSPHAHARIVSIDTEPALEMPGVTAVFTFDDIGIPCSRDPFRCGYGPTATCCASCSTR